MHSITDNPLPAANTSRDMAEIMAMVGAFAVRGMVEPRGSDSPWAQPNFKPAAPLPDNRIEIAAAIRAERLERKRIAREKREGKK